MDRKNSTDRLLNRSQAAKGLICLTLVRCKVYDVCRWYKILWIVMVDHSCLWTYRQQVLEYFILHCATQRPWTTRQRTKLSHGFCNLPGHSNIEKESHQGKAQDEGKGRFTGQATIASDKWRIVTNDWLLVPFNSFHLMGGKSLNALYCTKTSKDPGKSNTTHGIWQS